VELLKVPESKQAAVSMGAAPSLLISCCQLKILIGKVNCGSLAGFSQDQQFVLVLEYLNKRKVELFMANFIYFYFILNL
jgi:hypothetical protein